LGHGFPRIRQTFRSAADAAEVVRKQLEDSLKARNTDYLDLWHISAIQVPEDVDVRAYKRGIVEMFQLAMKRSGDEIKLLQDILGQVEPTNAIDLMKKLMAISILELFAIIMRDTQGYAPAAFSLPTIQDVPVSLVISALGVMPFAILSRIL
jgi:hypothetical protein